jgi:hypothetical protein
MRTNTKRFYIAETRREGPAGWPLRAPILEGSTLYHLCVYMYMINLF